MDSKFIDSLTSDELIDIRENEEWEERHLPNAKHIVKSELDGFPQAYLDKNKKYYIHCKSGKRAQDTVDKLLELGYDVENVGGIDDYEGDIRGNDHDLDCRGLQCPAPLVQTYKKISEIDNNDVLHVKATDIGFIEDMKNWTEKNGHKLLDSSKNDDGTVQVSIQKQIKEETSHNKNTTIVLFSGDYDKAIAAVIIAQGAASMGKEVSIFCTFWGLSFLKDASKSTDEKKTSMEKMFGAMMPSSMDSMPLSQMNFGGAGRSLIKSVMNKKNVDSLDTLFKNSIDLGVKFIACSMSMDLLGIKEDELYDNVTIGGVATYLSDSEEAGITLFI